jgi:hypothetical protein
MYNRQKKLRRKIEKAPRNAPVESIFDAPLKCPESVNLAVSESNQIKALAEILLEAFLSNYEHRKHKGGDLLPRINKRSGS